MRRVNKSCTPDQDCVVTCEPGEVAINALCPKRSAATLTSEAAVSCGGGNEGAMIGYCAR